MDFTGGRGRAFVTGGSGFIGTELVRQLLDAGWTVCNYDLNPAALPPGGIGDDRIITVQGDVRDGDRLLRAVGAFEPDALIHLAARTDTLSDDVRDYSVNTDGTTRVVEVVNATPSIRRFVHTSTQYVAGPGTDVRDPVRFSPFTAYGESKVISETTVRTLVERATWTIVRPANVWGPLHPRYPQEFWRVLARGMYVHPAGPPVVRTYGYVGNVAGEVLAILDLPEARVDGRVYYLGDEPIDIALWVDAFSIALRGRRARRVPLSVLKAIALAGDTAKRFGYPNPPLTSSRLHSMTADYVVPTAETIAELGFAGTDLQTGVDRTVEWLRAGRAGTRSAAAPSRGSAARDEPTPMTS